MLPVGAAGYSTRDLSTLVGVTPARVRAFVHDGFLDPDRGPRGEFRFSFQDAVLLRAAQGLVAAQVPPARVRRALRRLRQQLPTGRPLAGVRIAADGGRVVVRDGDEAWDPISGQTVLDFEVAELARRAAPLAARSAAVARRHESELDAADWFELGLELEATAPEEACDAYRRSIALAPDDADAHLNLGRLLHEEGEVGAAEGHYRRAVALRPGDATAAYNLGVALEDLGRAGEAATAYQQAIAADPTCADAYYNLAGIYERLGRKAAALRHLQTYRRLVRQG